MIASSMAGSRVDDRLREAERERTARTAMRRREMARSEPAEHRRIRRLVPTFALWLARS